MVPTLRVFLQQPPTTALAAADAFGRERVSNPETIFDSKLLLDNQPLFWDDAQTSGAGTSSTFNTNQASVSLGVANLTAGTRVRQTLRVSNYRPGKSQQIFMTFCMNAAHPGITSRVGYFDAQDGLFFQRVGSALSFVRRTFTSGAAVDNGIAQADWNIDKFDGTGPSGVVLDSSKVQILIIDFEWLGAGSVRFGFVVGGTIYYAHRFSAANELSLVYMSSPNLPLRYEIANDGSGPAATLAQICATVSSEGGQSFLGTPFSADRGETGLTTLNDSGVYPLIAMRIGAGYRSAVVAPLEISVIVATASAFRWVLLHNPTIVGAPLSFSAANAFSAVEVDVARTNATTVTGGVKIASGYGQQSVQSGGVLQTVAPYDYRLGMQIDGTSDVLVLGVQRLSSQAEQFFGSIAWREVK